MQDLFREWSLFWEVSPEVLKLDLGALSWQILIFIFESSMLLLCGPWLILRCRKKRLRGENSHPSLGIFFNGSFRANNSLDRAVSSSYLLPTLCPEANSPAEVEDLLGGECQLEGAPRAWGSILRVKGLDHISRDLAIIIYRINGYEQILSEFQRLR